MKEEKQLLGECEECGAFITTSEIIFSECIHAESCKNKGGVCKCEVCLMKLINDCL